MGESALTAAEWQRNASDYPVMVGASRVSSTSGAMSWPTFDADSNEMRHHYDGRDRHAIAALALHGQPFGFAHDDVAALRHIASDEPRLASTLTSIADRIAALLPPRAGEG